MDTEWICFDAVTGYDKGELNHAAQILRQGGLVAFPTETVYGCLLYTSPSPRDRG
mgnify:CR=1 FL=1